MIGRYTCVCVPRVCTHLKTFSWNVICASTDDIYYFSLSIVPPLSRPGITSKAIVQLYTRDITCQIFQRVIRNGSSAASDEAIAAEGSSLGTASEISPGGRYFLVNEDWYRRWSDEARASSACVGRISARARGDGRTHEWAVLEPEFARGQEQE